MILGEGLWSRQRKPSLSNEGHEKIAHDLLESLTDTFKENSFTLEQVYEVYAKKQGLAFASELKQHQRVIVTRALSSLTTGSIVDLGNGEYAIKQPRKHLH